MELVDVDFDRIFNGVGPEIVLVTPPSSPRADVNRDVVNDNVVIDHGEGDNEDIIPIENQQPVAVVPQVQPAQVQPVLNQQQLPNIVNQQQLPIGHPIVFVPQPNATPVLIYGHSFIRRLNEYLIHTKGNYHNLSLDYSQVITQWFGLGGLTYEKAIYRHMAIINLTSPAVIYLELGSNDLCFTHESAQDIFARVQQLVTMLNNLGVARVLIGQVLLRRGVGIPLSTPNYNRKVLDLNNLIRTTYTNIRGPAYYWRHRGLWCSRRGVLGRDGIHLNRRGQERLFRSIRGAILFALNHIP